jgi:hypothetical protein
MKRNEVLLLLIVTFLLFYPIVILLFYPIVTALPTTAIVCSTTPTGIMDNTGGAGASCSSRSSSNVWYRKNKIDLGPETVIEFFTDLEGNWEYFSSLVERSSVVHLEADGSLSLASNNSIFVHGGDSPDKGPCDIQIVKALVQLKKTYPDRVFLICGNRDVNKLRFMSELAENTEPATIYWDEKAVPYDEFLETNGLAKDDPISKLKWMLECTMGSPTTFETRRMELAMMKEGGEVDATNNNVSDEDVWKNFRDSVDPVGSDPWMLDYLRHSQLMLIAGDAVFVHGGIDEQSLGKVPGITGTFDDLEAWCAALNTFCAKSIAEFERQPLWNNDSEKKTHHRGGELLIDYGVPGGFGGATVIYKTHMVNGNCVEPDDATVQYLTKAGIKRLFTGHQPVGDCPSVIADVEGLSIFMCDTSYSDVKADKMVNPSNNRGAAMSNVIITKAATSIKGRLSNGEEHGFSLKVTSEGSSLLPNSLVGRELLDGSWVKTIVGGKPLVAKGEGRIIVTREMDIEDVVSQLKRPL